MTKPKIDPVVRLPIKMVRHSDGTITAPAWNPLAATEAQVTRSATRSYEDTTRHPEPFGDPPPRHYNPVKFERKPEPEPKVSFPNGIKTIEFDSHPLQANNVTPVAPGTRLPRRRVVGARRSS